MCGIVASATLPSKGGGALSSPKIFGTSYIYTRAQYEKQQPHFGWGNFLHGQPRMLTRDLFAVIVSRTFILLSQLTPILIDLVHKTVSLETSRHPKKCTQSRVSRWCVREIHITNSARQCMPTGWATCVCVCVCVCVCWLCCAGFTLYTTLFTLLVKDETTKIPLRAYVENNP